VRVLRAARHRNKLRTGHLKGNRFAVLVRDVDEMGFDRAKEICDAIQSGGFPNYFGGQRFGNDGKTLRLGLELLSGRASPRALPRSRSKFLSRLALSAVQSHLFNRVLAERVAEGTAGRVLAGDVMQVVESGGQFLAADVPEEQLRRDAGETAVTGPLFGPKMKQPAGDPASREAHILEACGLRLEDFNHFPKLTSGTRRAFLVRPAEFSLERDPHGIRLGFMLPPGAYATSLLREVMKIDEPTGEARDPSR
jgi:tRNA pseudouridine13 synthase